MLENLNNTYALISPESRIDEFMTSDGNTLKILKTMDSHKGKFPREQVFAGNM